MQVEDKDRITAKLGQLSELYAQRDLLMLDKAWLIEEVTPAEVRQAVADIELECGFKEAAITDTIEALAGDVKAAVVDAGASVKGEHLHAVYNKGRISWDTKGIAGYAVAHPEIEAFRKVGKPSVSLRRR